MLRVYLKRIFLVAVPFAVSVFYIFLTVWNVRHVEVLKNASAYQTVSNGIYEIEKCDIDSRKGTVAIEGWFFLPDQEITQAKGFVVLYNEDTDVYYRIPTQILERDDIKERYEMEGFTFKKSNCGFIAMAKLDDLKNKGRYEVYYLYLSDGNSIIQNMGTDFTWEQ